MLLMVLVSVVGGGGASYPHSSKYGLVRKRARVGTALHKTGRGQTLEIHINKDNLSFCRRSRADGSWRAGGDFGGG
jgi:hypothetical protein